jgi:glutathione S-transferase
VRYTYWLHYAEGSAMPPLLLALVFSRLPKGPVPFFLKPIVKGISKQVMKVFINPQLRLHLDYMEAELTKSAYFAGEDFTAADIQMSFPIEAAGARGGLGDKRPKLAAWLERIHARPAYQRALQKGGPYELMS